MSFVVVVYDIVEDKRRRKLRKKLDRLLQRVQKSVFEGPDEGDLVEEVRRVVEDQIDMETDTVRVFHLCPRCAPRTELFGTAELVPDEPEDLIVEG